MYQRQQKVSVYIGNFVALPHAEGQDEQVLKRRDLLLFKCLMGSTLVRKQIEK